MAEALGLSFPVCYREVVGLALVKYCRDLFQSPEVHSLVQHKREQFSTVVTNFAFKKIINKLRRDLRLCTDFTLALLRFHGDLPMDSHRVCMLTLRCFVMAILI